MDPTNANAANANPPADANRSSSPTDPTRLVAPDDPASELANVLDQYLADLQAGQQPDRQRLLADHPEQAAQLEQCLAGIEFIHRAAATAPTRLGDFRILGEVGRGGMGVVYEAEQISLKRRVALKVLRYGAAADNEAMQRFQREAETVATLHHTNIVPIFAIGCENGVHYYAMQFIEGHSLADATISRNALASGSDPQQPDASAFPLIGQSRSNDIANWGLQAAEALAHAHHRGVIHRDIKPSNLILDPDGRIWLTDFGLAKRMDDVSLSMAGAILGTPRYMSPEQAAASKNPVDHRTDIYSLGATLYELATGRPLFEGDSPHLVITQILTNEPPAPRVVCPNLHRDFETIILKCLAKEPAQRYATAQALADDLRAFVEGRAIKARRSTLVEQAARWFKQQKRSVGVAAAAVAATIAVVVGGLIAWQMHSQAKLGYLTLNTPREGDQRAEVAEVLSLDDVPVLSPFTLPTKEPVALPEGAYRLRLTAPSKVSQSYLFDVAAGASQTHEVGLVNETVGHAIPLRSPVGVEVSEPRLFVGPQDANRPTLRCYSVLSQPQQQAVQEGSSINVVRSTDPMPLWEANWSLDAPDIISFLKLPADREAWKVLPAQWDVAAWQQVLAWFDPSWFRNGTPPKVLQPARDLNGDGAEDVIWSAPQLANRQQGSFGPGPLTPKAAVLVAASGKDGQPLWWFRPQDASGSASRLLGEPIWAIEPTRDHAGIIVCGLRTTQGMESWVEAVSSTTGESLWRSRLAPVVPQSSAWLTTTTMPDGKLVVVAVLGRHLVVLDAATGECQPRATATEGDFENHLALRGNEYVLDARFADLDSDGITEALLTIQTSDRGIHDTAFSVSQNKTLWEVPSSFEVGAYHQNEARHSWPLIADLDGDNKPEVILPGKREEGANVSDGCRVLDGMTGEARWTRRFPNRFRNRGRKPEQFVVGPDLDGDGKRELFMASIRSEYGARMVSQTASHHYEECFLYVDCFSGRDGRSVWWQRIPLGFSEYAAWTGITGEMLWWGMDSPLGAPEGVSPRT
ncbi:MAG: serine/threonine protein kinase, partial [Planctomycetales bacterium]|nr:serine/threonine protein kinase [Planctomycetales bacterium]